LGDSALEKKIPVFAGITINEPKSMPVGISLNLRTWPEYAGQLSGDDPRKAALSQSRPSADIY